MHTLGMHAAFHETSTLCRSLAAAVATSMLLLAASSAQALTFSPSCFTNHPGPAAVADFNEDGKPDIAMSNWTLDPGGAFILLPDAAVFLGHGDGTFAPPVLLNTSNAAAVIYIIAADANNDGHMDVVSANAAGNISVFEGRGNGTFASMKNYGAAGVVTGLTAGDFNGDGKTDFATSDGQYASVSVLLGTGKGGGLKGRVRYDSGFTGRAITTADFNGDGKLDLITANAASAGPLGTTLSVLLGHGDGTFGPAALVSLPRATGREILAADFNQDGKMDVVLGTQGVNGSGVLELIGNGDGTFAPAAYSETSANGTNFTASLWVGVGDLNGDGRPDVVTSNRRFDAGFHPIGQEGTALLAQANGALVVDSNFSTHYGIDVNVADFNGDGLGDVLTDDCVQLQVAPLVQSIRAGGDPATPVALSLSFAPNPWHADGRVNFTLPQSGRVALGVYDITGRRVLSIVDGQSFAAGTHSLALAQGAVLAPGVYMARLQTAAGTALQRLVVSGN